MKIRTDFVSNSSSTSFMLNIEDLKLDSLDERFFKLIGRVESLYFTSAKENYSEDLIKDAKKKFGKRLEVYDDQADLDLNSVKIWEKDNIEIITRLLKESVNVTCSYGCDDCGEYVGEATQVCTALELLYGIIPEGNDHFDYSSIKRLGVMI